MPSLAKAYIAMIAALAVAVLTVVASRWTPENFGRFFLFFALAMVASAMKIRLPGFKTTISTNFVFILIGIALFSFGETVLIGLGGALVQSLWKTQTRPKLVQVLFNAACLTVCTAAAFWASHSVLAMLGLNSLAAMMVLGACVYVVLNTGLVSLVIALAEVRPVADRPWPQLGRNVGRLAGDVFCLCLLPDAHLPRRTREYFQREPRRPNGTRWRISRPLSSLPSILVCTHENP